MKKLSPRQLKLQAGFTIVELMIATAAFSLVLLLLIYGVLNFTHSYYAGINRSTTQDTARNVVGGVSQAIEFSGTPITPTQDIVLTGINLEFFCTGNDLFLYRPGIPYTGVSNMTTPGLYEQTLTGSCPDPANPATLPSNLDPKGRQLLGKGMRVTWLKVQAKTALTYSIDLRLALGARDLLCAPTAHAGSCSPGAPILNDIQLNSNDVVCKLQTGYQFCAVAALGTIAALRVEGAE